jgi:hypothetical protein
MTAAAAASVVLGSAVFAAQYTTQSVNGATGLITTPTANVGYQNKKSTGVDIGYHHLADSSGSGNVVKETFSFFGRAELGGTVDIQNRDDPYHKNEIEIIVHGKFKILNEYSRGLAVGGNFQFIDLNNDYTNGKVLQLYLAYTFSATIFTLPAETTFVIGKSLNPNNMKAGYRKRGGERQLYLKINDDNDIYTRTGNIDFSVGFDIDLLPQYLKGHLHWITDFANYSYSADPMGSLPDYRACANTGFRVIPLKFRNCKWNIDILATDFLDHRREWAVGTTFGFGI